MKKTKFYLISLFFIGILFTFINSCQNEDLPKANYDLKIVPSFTGTVGHEQVNLEWSEPKSNKIEKYLLTWMPGDGKVIVDNSKTSYQVKGLENGKTYEFNIQADYGNLGLSGVKEIKLTPKDELNFTVLPGNGFAYASWDIPSSRNDISEFILKWEDNSIKLNPETTSYQIKNLVNDKKYDISLVIHYKDDMNGNPVINSVVPGDIKAFVINNESPQKGEKINLSYNPAFLASQTASNWQWDFGDGNSSNEENPQHTYNKTGKYNISLTVTDTKGRTYSSDLEVNVWGEKWTYDIGSAIKPQIPAIGDDGTIYIGSENNKEFLAINSNGTLKWNFSMLKDNVYSSASVADDGTIYVGSKDNYLYAIDSNGSLKWKFNTESIIIYSTPSIGSDGTIYIGSDSGNVYAINPDGSLKWKFSTGGKVRSTVAIDSNNNIYVASSDKKLYCLNSNGKEKWSYDLFGVVEGGISIGNDGSIFLSMAGGKGEGKVLSLNSDGSKKWETSVSGRILSSPVIADDRVYFGTKDSNQLIALDISNGSEVWNYEAGNIILSTPSVDKNGNIYFSSFDNNVYVLNSDGSLKYKFDTGDKTWSSPVIGNDGTVYIGGYNGKLYALEFFAEGPQSNSWSTFGYNPRHISRK